jgi:hypothetical protein
MMVQPARAVQKEPAVVNSTGLNAMDTLKPPIAAVNTQGEAAKLVRKKELSHFLFLLFQNFNRFPNDSAKAVACWIAGRMGFMLMVGA